MYYDKYIELSDKEKNELHEKAINQIGADTKAVIRLNDNKIYQNATNAKIDTIKSDDYAIIQCCENKYYKSRKMPNGEDAFWMFYHEYFKLSDKQKTKILYEKRNKFHKSCEPKTVKNLDTGIIYPSLKAAGNAYGKKDGLNIANAINRDGTAYGFKWAYI